MRLAEIWIENFRNIGSKEDDKHFYLEFQPGLNVIVGENDSGKSAIVDAIRYCLWTTDFEYNRLTIDDFHVSGENRKNELIIKCVFRNLSQPEEARFLEWLSFDNDQSSLYVTMKANLIEGGSKNKSQRIITTCRAGKDATGPAIEGDIREFLKITYLRPLRDAEAALSAGRGSRLAQILGAHPDCVYQGVCNFDETDPERKPSTLIEIMRQAELQIQNNPFIQQSEDFLNQQYLKIFSIGEDILEGKISIARQAELRHILEKLELWLKPKEGANLRTPRGLGVNNVLFIAAELLLLTESGESLPLLIIEEPEAHLHPQMQLRLMHFLEERSKNSENNIQIIVTTHSPNLASQADLEHVSLICDAQAYPLAHQFTRLEKSDYNFLRRFLDVTKANLFFAKGLVIVEGDAENLLLPSIAKLIDRPFSENGISIINVGSRGLFRYSRIFQRDYEIDNRTIPIRVACITDRDIVPEEVEYYTGKEKETNFSEEEITKKIQQLKSHDGDNVRTFVSPNWTLEYDLAFCGLSLEMYTAIQLAKKTKNKTSGVLSSEEIATVTESAIKTHNQWIIDKLTPGQIATKIYEPLYLKQASKAETAQFLAEILEGLPITPDKMIPRLPAYLVEAINFVTSSDYQEGI